MGDRIDEIRRRHKQRKHQYTKSDFTRLHPVLVQESKEAESPRSLDQPYLKHADGSRSHTHRQHILFRWMVSIVIVLVVGVIFKGQSSAFTNARAFVKHTFQNEFQFAVVSGWYQKTFGEPLSLFPTSKKGVNVAKKDTTHYAEPVSGSTVKESFADTGKGILLTTGNKAAVKAVKQGFIVDVGKNEELGKYVKIEHSDGTQSWYGKLEKIDVSLYDFVKRDEKVGTVTSSKDGRSGTFYFALKQGGTFINPLKVISFD